MPCLKGQPVVLGSIALIVGNGPTNVRCPWPAIRNGMIRDGAGPTATWLINNSALGRTIPDFAVAVDIDIVGNYVANGLPDRCRVVTNHPDVICGPERWRESIGDAPIEHAPSTWPALASGPLAIWTAAALGFETIAIYGLDGTMTGGDDEFNRHARVWESWILRWKEARPRIGVNGGSRQRLMRVWPDGVGRTLLTDPLKNCLDGALDVRPA